MSNNHEIIIPFGGFYNSIHDTELDHYLEQSLSDDNGEIREGIELDKAYDSIDWRKVHIDYSKLYVDNFKNWLSENGNITLHSLTFKELDSPKEYNFTTDKIVCTISALNIHALFNVIDYNILSETIAERHTSCDGFISFYPNTIEEWPTNRLDWDCVQLQTLLIAYVKSLDFYEDVNEWYLMEHAACNGEIDNLLWDNMSEDTVNYLNQLESMQC